MIINAQRMVEGKITNQALNVILGEHEISLVEILAGSNSVCLLLSPFPLALSQQSSTLEQRGAKRPFPFISSWGFFFFLCGSTFRVVSAGDGSGVELRVH
jgi:hypothetical protein